MMDLRQLEAFVSIATLGSFRGAANRLNLSQPAVSLRLKALEDELGTQLVERATNGVQLTAQGLQLFGLAEQILESAHRFKATAAGAPQAQQRIRLGVTSTIVNAWLPELIDAILNEHRHFVLDVVVSTTRNLRVQLSAGELDIAIMMGPLHEANVRNVPLKTYGNQWIAAEDFPLPDRRLSLREVASYPIITYARDSASYGNLEEALRQNGLWPAAVSTSNSVSIILNSVARGKCVGIISDSCLPKEGIRTLDCELPPDMYEYFLSYHMDTIGRVGMAIADIAKRVC